MGVVRRVAARWWQNLVVSLTYATFFQVCDFGSAMFAGQNEITPYLVSRFYRPPEVVLGLEYSFPMDLWAIGCCLFELFTGKMAFPGKSNNEMVFEPARVSNARRARRRFPATPDAYGESR